VSVGSIGGANLALAAHSNQNTTASLEGQIRAAREQLNDWVTCVSASTPKGQAEIRSLTAQISAAEEKINRLSPAQSTSGAALSSPSLGARLDVWA
jgi:hypothetical protein